MKPTKKATKAKAAKRNQWHRIRMGGTANVNEWLDKEGMWGPRKRAKAFRTQQAADEFAERHGIFNYGLF